LTGSSAVVKTTGIVRVAAFAARRNGAAGGNQDRNRLSHEFGC
jgi:hypothetical protein